MPKTVLAIDPGSSKVGLALVTRQDNGDIRLVWHGICPRSEAVAQVGSASEIEPYSLVVIGGGTSSKPLISELREAYPSLALLVVDERDTSFQARERYWEHNPRRGWRKLIPSTMQMPNEPIDDFAALILAERVLANN